MKAIIALLLIALATLPGGADAGSPKVKQKERFARFEKLLKKNDFAGTEKLLQEWQKASPNDAELAVGWSNYYGKQGMQPIRWYGGPPQAKNVELDKGALYSMARPGTTETIGYIDTRPLYDDEMLTRALAVLRDATTTHPQRTDIWMGATHIQMVAADLDGAFATLRNFTEYAHANPAKLRTRFDEPVKDKASEFMPETLHQYALRGYKEETTSGLEFLLNVARLSQEYYPDHPYAYNDEAVYYNHLEEDDKVLECLLRAHKVRPRDALVCINIAATYKNLGQKEKAAEYLKLTIKLSDDKELKADARESLKELDAE